MPRGRTLRTREKEAFLAALGEGLSVSGACRRAGIGRTAAYALKDADAGFRATWESALEQGTDALEDEARRRAVEGVAREKGVYHRGQQVAVEVETQYSDTLLIFLLKGRRPEKFRDNVDLTTKGEALTFVDIARRLARPEAREG